MKQRRLAATAQQPDKPAGQAAATFTHVTKGQMVAGSAEQDVFALQAWAPSTLGCSLNRLRIQVKAWPCRKKGRGERGQAGHAVNDGQ